MKFRYLIAASVVALSPACAWAQGVAAQDPAPRDGQDAAEPAEIVVTGSRIQRSDGEAVSPVSVIGREQIALDQSLNIENVLETLPQTVGSFSGVSNGADARGAATADLRGLGQNRTLVLIDGTRGAPFGFRNSVDLNSIPAPLVERVEVLTGGAAAVYGADAVAGVVNFIMRDDFEGMEGNLVTGITERGDGTRYGANLLVGADLGGRGNVTGYVGYSKREPIFKSQRDFAAPERNDSGPILTAPLGGTFTLENGTRFGFTDNGALTEGATQSSLTGRQSLLIEQEQLNADLFFHYDVTDAIQVYGRGMYTRTVSRDQLPPVTASGQVLISRDNPYLTPELRQLLEGSFNRTLTGETGGDQAALVRISRSIGELGNRITETTRNSGQAQLGVRGDLGAVHWDGYVQYGVSDSSGPVFGEGVASRFRQAAGATVDANGNPVCIDQANGCAPANIFGAGNISAQALAFFGAPVVLSRKREQFVAAGTLSGDTESFLSLPGGPIAWVAGVEYRSEDGDNRYDGLIQTGQTFNQGTRANFGGSYDVVDYYGELRVPLLDDLPFARELSIEGAYRYSDYSTSGGTDAYKIGGIWSPVRDITFRGSYQRVVRAPNIGELFGTTSGIPLANFAQDPCANVAASGADPETCRASGAPAGNYQQDLTGALFLYGGRPDIQPEVGNTWTAGVALTPQFIPGLSLTADYYDITIDNAIGAVLPQATLDTCFVIVRDIDNLFCQQITRGANGQLTSVNSSDINVAKLTTEGVDLIASYRRPIGAVAFNLSYAGTLVLGQTQKNGVAAPTLECAGRFGSTCGLEARRALPEYKHRVDLSGELNGITMRATWRLLGAVEDDSPTVYEVERLGEQNYFDLAFSVRATDHARLTFGVDNVFDNTPPLAGTNSADANTFPQSYDVLGRRYMVTFTLRD